MKKTSAGAESCKKAIKKTISTREDIPAIVDALVSTCSKAGCFDHVSAEPIPYREAVIDILRRLALILYPGYFIKHVWIKPIWNITWDSR